MSVSTRAPLPPGPPGPPPGPPGSLKLWPGLPGAPIATTCMLVTPAGTTNVCSLPVEVNVTLTAARAGVGTPGRTPSTTATTPSTQTTPSQARRLETRRDRDARIARPPPRAPWARHRALLTAIIAVRENRSAV